MKEMCRTRWVERHEAFEVFLDLFMPTITCLEAIARSRPAEWNRDTRSDAHSLFLALSQFSFVVALVLTQKVLAYTKGLSIKLQGRYVDVVHAHRDIESVKSSLERNRSEIDVFHDRVYDAVLVLAQSVGIDESSPRISSRQQHRQNVPADNTKEYYKRTLTIPILDHLISELDERFDADSSLVVVEFMELLPSTIIGHDQSHLQLSKLTNLVSCYENDLPSSRALDTELDMWENKWRSEHLLARELDTPEKVIRHIDQDYYPNICVLFQIMVTLPVTSCECERSISMLRLIKTHLGAPWDRID